MINYIRKLGIWEYVFAIMGIVILTKLTINFWNDTLENTALNGIALIVGVLLLSAPRYLVKAIKDKASVITKK